MKKKKKSKTVLIASISILLVINYTTGFPFNCQQTLRKKMKFFTNTIISKCDKIHSFLRIWSHLLKKSLMENFIFCAVKSLTLLSITKFNRSNREKGHYMLNINIGETISFFVCLVFIVQYVYPVMNYVFNEAIFWETLFHNRVMYMIMLYRFIENMQTENLGKKKLSNVNN